MRRFSVPLIAVVIVFGVTRGARAFGVWRDNKRQTSVISVEYGREV